MNTLYIAYVAREKDAKYMEAINELTQKAKERLFIDFAKVVDFEKVYRFELRQSVRYMIDDGISRLEASKGEYDRMILVSKQNGSEAQYSFERQYKLELTYEVSK